VKKINLWLDSLCGEILAQTPILYHESLVEYLRGFEYMSFFAIWENLCIKSLILYKVKQINLFGSMILLMSCPWKMQWDKDIPKSLVIWWDKECPYAYIIWCWFAYVLNCTFHFQSKEDSLVPLWLNIESLMQDSFSFRELNARYCFPPP